MGDWQAKTHQCALVFPTDIIVQRTGLFAPHEVKVVTKTGCCFCFQWVVIPAHRPKGLAQDFFLHKEKEVPTLR
jgi:hypothetical protein